MTDERADIARQLNEAGGKAVVERENEKPSRRQKKALTSWHDPAVLRQMKAIAYEKDKTQQELAAEALNLLFAKYGKGQIA
jgi:hypothetical protein